MKVFIANPSKGKTPEEMRRDFDRAAEDLKKRGHEVLPSAEMHEGRVDVDFVLFLKGWIRDARCRAIHETCKTLNIPKEYD